ncbi:hypothetical protein KBI23_00940 [bacterium]|nr:hypothetical protein [bacterium]MBP9808928.1 hypothetical protein [bacterium]
MPYAPAEFTEAPSAKALNSAESAASNNMMKEVQNYQEQKRGANIIGTAETLTGDEAVKKMFNGKEVEKILKDFVINEDHRRNPSTGGLKDDLGDCLLPPKGPKNIKEFQPSSDANEGQPKKGSGSVNIDLNDSKFLRRF